MAVEFELPVGTSIQLELLANHQHQKAQVHLIGYEPGKSLLVSMPRVDGEPMPLLLNDDVAVRYLHGNAVHAFETAVSRICKDPFPYLHLLFPRSIESVKVRSAERVSIRLEGEAHTGEDANVVPIELLDLSIGGARITSPRDLGDVNEQFTLRFGLTFAGLTESMGIPVTIRSNTRKSQDEYQFGVSFVELDEQQRVFLQGCIYETLHRQR